MTEKKSCPNCAEMIKSDAILCRFCESGLSTEHFQPCPLCSEMIRKDAILCRFCKYPTEKTEAESDPLLVVKEEDPKVINLNRVRENASTRAEILSDQSSPKSAFGEGIACDITAKLRQNRDLESIIEDAIEFLTRHLGATRGIVWRIKGDHLRATNEFSVDGHICFLHSQLTAEESTSTVLEILSRFPDESGSGIIEVKDATKDKTLQQDSPTMSALIELGGVKSRLIAQLRSNGIIDGFIEMQHCGDVTDWSKEDTSTLEIVASAISAVVRQISDRSTINNRINDISLVSKIAAVFNNSQDTQESIERFAELVSNNLGFEKSQVYLLDTSKKVLKGQLENDDLSKVVQLSESSSKKSAISSAFHSIQHKMINVEYTNKKDPVFGHDTAVVLPLVASCERLGVMALHKRKEGNLALTPVDLSLLQSVSSFLAQAVYIEKLKK